MGVHGVAGEVILFSGGGALDGAKVLILEDEFLIAMDVEQICRDHGAGEVTITRSLAEAEGLDLAGFDVAIIDVMVAGASSLDFAARLRDRGVPFIFASGYGRHEGMFADFPGIPVVGKPYAWKELLAAATEVIALARTRPAAPA